MGTTKEPILELKKCKNNLQGAKGYFKGCKWCRSNYL